MLAVLVAPMIAACGSGNLGATVKRAAFSSKEYGVAVSPRVTRDPNPPKGGGRYLVGKPYTVRGKVYRPQENPEGYTAQGTASWYGSDFHGLATANGEQYDMNGLTAAHRTLPLPSMVLVTNLENGRALKLRVNDRGPFAHGRIIDVSRRAAQLLGFEQQGTAKVRVEVLADESRILAATDGSGEYAVAGEPVPQAAPRVAVTAEPLPTPGGDGAAPGPSTTAPAPSTVPQLAAAPAIQPDGVVRQVPVRPTSIYIQAGAFSDLYNANRLQAQLSQFGAVRVTPVIVEGQQFYRVRLGPLASVEDGDRLLGQVVEAGHPEARLVVD